MHGSAGLVILALVLIGIPGFFGVRAVARHRGAPGKARPGGGIISGWFAHRRALREKQADHELGMHRDRFRSMLRMREAAERERRACTRKTGRGGTTAAAAGGATQDGAGSAATADSAPGPDPDAATGSAGPGAGPQGGGPSGSPGSGSPPPSGGWRATVTHVWGRWHPAGDAARAGARRGAIGPGVPGSPGRPGDPPRPPGSPEPPARGGGSAPPRPAPGQSPPAPSRPGPGPAAPPPVPPRAESPTLEGVVVTTPDTRAPSALAAAVPGVEEAVEGMRRIAAHMRAGNIRAKRRALLALVHVCQRGAAMSAAMARALAEPDQHYGPQVTEPVSLGSMFLSAAASSFSDGDAALKALLHSSLDESMRSGRQVPHHDELTETGAY